MRIVWVAFSVLFLSGCALFEAFARGVSGEGSGAASGAAAGATEFVRSIPSILDSAAGGGIVVGAVVAALSLWKAVRKGLEVANRKKIDIVAQGVKKANGKAINGAD